MEFEDIFMNFQSMSYCDIKSLAHNLVDIRSEKEYQDILICANKVFPNCDQTFIKSIVDLLLKILKDAKRLNESVVEDELRELRMKYFLARKEVHAPSFLTNYADNTKYLMSRHHKLLKNFQDELSDNQFTLLVSPPGTGKSTLIQLLHDHHPEYEYIPISFSKSQNTLEIFELEGINFRKRIVSESLKNPRNAFVFIIDDAHLRYEDEDFWYALLKGSRGWLPRNLKFIISAAHILTEFKSGYIDFVNLPTLDSASFLLNEEESMEFLHSPIGIFNASSFKTLIKIIAKECGGVIGALRITSFYINVPTISDVSIEDALICYFYSLEVLRYLSTCYSDGTR
jgi:DNA replication protein DnaC